MHGIMYYSRKFFAVGKFFAVLWVSKTTNIKRTNNIIMTTVTMRTEWNGEPHSNPS